MTTPGTAIVTGAGGQDGFFLIRRLLREGWTVHGVARGRRQVGAAPLPEDAGGRLTSHDLDVLDADGMSRLVRETQPDEIYNLAGHSSVSASFANPAEAWGTNAEAVLGLLEVIRRHAPATRMYQASSGEMFGTARASEVVHDEESGFLPESPYAVAKAAAHLLCGTYRRVFGLRVACGILFNHESHRRPDQFLSRKVTDHVLRIRDLPGGPSSAAPLKVGNLRAHRDWGFAPDYVDGMICILRQIEVRGMQPEGLQDVDEASHYRDYVLATGQLHAVWELVDRAFALGGMDLHWHRDAPKVEDWHATFHADGGLAVVVDPALLRPSDPHSIAADPSRAKRELGWSPQVGLDVFLNDMINRGA